MAEFSLTHSDKLHPTGIIVCPLLAIYKCTSTDIIDYAENSQTNDKPMTVKSINKQKNHGKT